MGKCAYVIYVWSLTETVIIAKTIPRPRPPQAWGLVRKDTYPLYIEFSETRYLEGFSGIENIALALTSYDYIDKDWRFSKM